jgi:hypothetical protein
MGFVKIIAKGTLIYLKNFFSLTKVMLFPIFGQLIGILLILLPSYFFSQNITRFMLPENIAKNFVLILLGLIVIILPGFFVFAKAFWEYMTAMVALNSSIGNIVAAGKLKDYAILNQCVKLRTKDYIVLLSLLTLIILGGLLLPLSIFSLSLLNTVDTAFLTTAFMIIELFMVFILLIISVYLSLAFQVFAFETISPVETIKRSWSLVRSSFWKTFFTGCAVMLVTGILIPSVFQSFAGKGLFLNAIVLPVQTYMASFSNLIDAFRTTQIGFYLLGTLTEYDIAKNLVLLIIGALVSGLILPLGSAYYTLLYYDLSSKES